MKYLIVTADDFGLCPEVNAAVLRAHQDGVLTSASLMVAAPAAGEAIFLAKENPSLKVGLHLVLVEGASVLSKKEIPHLVDAKQRFSDRVAWTGLRYFFSGAARREIERECEAQIQKFLNAGLPIDHLDSHNHFHIHPAIAPVIVALALKYNIPAVRLPWQGWQNFNSQDAWIMAAMGPWVFKLKRRLRENGILFNDRIFGLYETGRMTEKTWLKIIPKLRDGVTEIYCHPALSPASILQKTMPCYRHFEEWISLLSKRVRGALNEAKVERTTFSDLKKRAS